MVNSLRRSLSGTTLFSQTSTGVPLMVDPTDLPGVAKAFVSFLGFQIPNAPGRLCDIIKKSTNVLAVSTTPNSTARGDYTISFAPGTFPNRDYMVVGSVETDSLDPISAANTFYVKASGASGRTQSPNFLTIQTINTTLTSDRGFAYARRINLIIYK